MEFQRQVGGREIRAACDPRFAKGAEALLAKMEELDQKGPALRDGSRVQYGWSLLTLKAEDGALRVLEPDYDGDPFKATRPVLDSTLEVLAGQKEVLRRTGLEGEDVRFSDEAYVRSGALDSPAMFLKRQAPARAGDSGWFLGSPADLEGKAPAQPGQALRVYELLGRRPALMQVLALPPDYVVMMEGEDITAVFGVDGRDLWNGIG